MTCSPSDQPDQNQARDRGGDPHHPQDIVGRFQRALHRPAHEGGARREQDAFQHKQDSDADEEVDERNGPHRTLGLPENGFLVMRRRAKRNPPRPSLTFLTASARPRPQLPPPSPTPSRTNQPNPNHSLA